MSTPRIPILMYHQIDVIPPKRNAKGERTQFRSLIVSPGRFARQMWLLKTLGYRGVSMSELMPYLRGEKTFAKDGKVVGITFDDGYQNNLVHAMPVLARYGFTSTCYVVSGLAGLTNRWDVGKGVAEKSLMTPSEMRDWIAGGQEIGSHTAHHVDLLKVDAQAANTEIVTSKHALEAMSGVACKHFCYPYGNFNDSHADMARAAGYETATTTEHGDASADSDAMRLPRLGVLKNTHLWQFWQLIRG